MARCHCQLRVCDPEVFLLLPATPLAHRHARILRTIPVDHTLFCFTYPDLHHRLLGATGATDVPMLAFTGVARKAWISPACRPLSTVAMPEICPGSLIFLAMVGYRLELAGNSVLRSLITPPCQMKAWDQLKLESQVLPTTRPLLLMPLARAPKSPGRVPRFVIAPFCQRAALTVVASGLRTSPT